MKDAGGTLPDGLACERVGAGARERAGAHARKGDVKSEGGSGGPAEPMPGAWARVRARARITAAANGSAAVTATGE